MKAFLEKIWAAIKRFLHIGYKVVQEELEETKEELIARLKVELAQLDKEIESATGEALEQLQAKAQLIHAELLRELRDNLKD